MSILKDFDIKFLGRVKPYSNMAPFQTLPVRVVNICCHDGDAKAKTMQISFKLYSLKMTRRMSASAVRICEDLLINIKETERGRPVSTR